MKTHDILSRMLLIASSFLSVPLVYAGTASIDAAVSRIESQAQRVQSSISATPEYVIKSGSDALSSYADLTNKASFDFSLSEFVSHSSLYKLFYQEIYNNPSLKMSLPVIIWLFLSGFIGFLRLKRGKMVA